MFYDAGRIGTNIGGTLHLIGDSYSRGRRRCGGGDGANFFKNLLAHLFAGGRVGSIDSLGGVDIDFVNRGIEYGLDLLVRHEEKTGTQEGVRYPVAIEVVDVHAHLQRFRWNLLDHAGFPG